MQLPCYECALRACGLFKPVTPEELSFINEIKLEHLLRSAGAEIIRAGDPAPDLYTLYAGWAFRFKTLPDGRRQIFHEQPQVVPDIIAIEHQRRSPLGAGMGILKPDSADRRWRGQVECDPGVWPRHFHLALVPVHRGVHG